MTIALPLPVRAMRGGGESAQAECWRDPTAPNGPLRTESDRSSKSLGDPTSHTAVTRRSPRSAARGHLRSPRTHPASSGSRVGRSDVLATRPPAAPSNPSAAATARPRQPVVPWSSRRPACVPLESRPERGSPPDHAGPGGCARHTPAQHDRPSTRIYAEANATPRSASSARCSSLSWLRLALVLDSHTPSLTGMPSPAGPSALSVASTSM